MEDKYRQELLTAAEQLSERSVSFVLVRQLAERFVASDDEGAAVELLRALAVDYKAPGFSMEVLEAVRAVKNSLLLYCGHNYIRKAFDRTADANDGRNIDELLAELESLVGLNTVKDKVRDLIAYQRVQKMRREKGLVSPKNTLHLSFTGNPGTGKTTVARIVGRIYREIGLLSKGHFVEVSRTDLIAGYQGQTALKVKKVIERARGGVLFIDEAYSITENDHSDSYGRECLTELTKALEDCRDDLVVIVAGYSKPMEKFFESNPGLKSRFNTFIEFPDYSGDELSKIFKGMCEQNDYIATGGLLKKVESFFGTQVAEHAENFANGRLARNLFEDIVMAHARRCVTIDSPSRNDLEELLAEDMKFAVA